MCVSVAAQQQYLEKQHACCPHGGRAAKPRQDVFADQWLDLEEQKCPGKNRQRINEHGANCCRMFPFNRQRELRVAQYPRQKWLTARPGQAFQWPRDMAGAAVQVQQFLIFLQKILFARFFGQSAGFLRRRHRVVKSPRLGIRSRQRADYIVFWYWVSLQARSANLTAWVPSRTALPGRWPAARLNCLGFPGNQV